MRHIDVFNGDADGLCALLQLQWASPREAELVTGVKRDIELLAQVQAGAGDLVTVLDISLDKNRADVQRLLDAGAEVFYVDHHFAGAIPESPRLTTLINEAPNVCTSLLVNGHLENRFAAWAVVGAYGDNLKASAEAIARPLDLSTADLSALEALGTYLNYNGYGETVSDLHFPPATLFGLLRPHANPLDFIHGEGRAYFEQLAQGYASDMAAAAATAVLPGSTANAAALVLPDEPWARRVSGVYSNDLANVHPDRAHAVLTEKADGSGYLVSVRAALVRKKGADELCRQFATGGGRAAAAGINHLPVSELQKFLTAFQQKFAA